MNDDLHRFLDGELPEDVLDERGREDAAAWDRLLGAFRVEPPVGGAPPWLEQRVMAQIEALPSPGVGRRMLDWLLRPHQVRVSPLVAGLAVALIAVIIIPGGEPVIDESSTLEPIVADTQSDAFIYVQFRLEARGATSVAVAGDFTGWTPSQGLQDPDGDGVWTGRVAIRPGVYGYMFVIDGSEWVTDPDAGRYQDDGFGSRNAVLAVTSPPSA